MPDCLTCGRPTEDDAIRCFRCDMTRLLEVEDDSPEDPRTSADDTVVAPRLRFFPLLTAAVGIWSATASVVLPLQVVAAVPAAVLHGVDSVLRARSDPSMSSGLTILAWVLSPLISLVAHAYTTSASFQAGLAAARGEPPLSLRDASARGAERYLALLGWGVSFAIVSVMGYGCCVFPFLFVVAAFGIGGVIVVAEDASPVLAFQRSFELTAGHRPTTFALSLFVLATALVIMLPPKFAIGLLFPESPTAGLAAVKLAANGLVSVASLAFLGSIVSGIVVATYAALTGLGARADRAQLAEVFR